MLNQRSSCPPKELSFILVLLCTLFGFAVCGPCAKRDQLGQEINAVNDVLDYDACGSFVDNSGLAGQEFGVGGISSNYVQGDSPTVKSLKSVCTNSKLFCFPSTLHDLLVKEDNHEGSSMEIFGSQDDVKIPEAPVPHDSWEKNSSWLENNGAFVLLNGKTVSCSLNSGMKPDEESSIQSQSVDQSNSDSGGGPSLKYHRPFNILDTKSELITSNIINGSSSSNVDISPSFLDWGQSYLFFPSSAFVTVSNTCNESKLLIYVPYSTDKQFHPCKLGEILLGPGEAARICFVFLPQQLGLLSAHIVLQTSSGGFLIHAKGMVIESLFQIQPLVGLNISLDVGLNRNLSLYNPFDDTLYVKEVTAWISVYSENISHSADAICTIDNFQRLGGYNFLHNIQDWLNIRSDQVDMPLMALRPHGSWEINPHSSEPVVEINFLSGAEGTVFGAFSMEVQSSSQDRAEVIVVPLEAVVHGKSAYSDSKGSVLVYLEPIPCVGCERSIVLSLKNAAVHLLHIAKISEVAEWSTIFHIKYMDGLLLFPGTVTQIAVITCPLGDSQEPPDRNFDIHLSCKLLVLTNDSGSPKIEIPCQDVVKACSYHQSSSYIGTELRHEKSMSGGEITGSSGNVIHSSSGSSAAKSEETTEVDEMVLRNWISQGTSRNISVLDRDEVLYPVVAVGGHSSKWITVKNPSDQPVLVQLILNSGTVIDQCKSPDNFVDPPLSGKFLWNDSTRPTSYGFSIADTAMSEAFVHPYGKALLGPITFHPSNRCRWRSSVLIRNNLSGVEWLSLGGFGGSFSLALLQGSEPIKSLEFKLNLPNPVNLEAQESLVHIKNISAACSMSLSKEFYAINTGDVPLEVRKIEVSGGTCGLDGFMVHMCKSFFLEPGESRKLKISYKTDFSAAVVHRDLELALATGIFVIPMKASFPVHMLGVCRKSFIWALPKKLYVVVFITAGVLFAVFSFTRPKLKAFGSQDYLFKTESGTISKAGESSVESDQRKSGLFLYYNMMSLLRSVRKKATLKLHLGGRFSDCLSEVQEQRTVEEKLPVQDNQEKIMGIPEPESEIHLLQCSSVVKSMALESSLPTQASNLTVRVGKDKGKRRRRKRSKGANGTGLTGLLEVSSSQSGNSTPSSPMSPLLSFMPKATWSLSPDRDGGIQPQNPFVKVATENHVKEQVFKPATGPTLFKAKVSGNFGGGSQSLSSQSQSSLPGKVISKPILLPPATFPSSSQRLPVVIPPQLLRSASVVNPKARAPGSNLKDKAIRDEEKERPEEEKKSPEDEYKYDIWGDHFPGLDLNAEVDEVSPVISQATEGDSQSFFIREPQILMRKSVSLAPNCAETPLHQND